MATSAIVFFCFIGLILFGIGMFIYNFIQFGKNEDDNTVFNMAYISIILSGLGSGGALISGIVWIVNKLAH